jgi:hypothetical protein
MKVHYISKIYLFIIGETAGSGDMSMLCNNHGFMVCKTRSRIISTFVAKPKEPRQVLRMRRGKESNVKSFVLALAPWALQLN